MPKLKKDTTTTPAAPKQPSLIADNTKLELVIPAAEAQKAYQAQLKKAAKNVKMQGFRQGKAPLKKVEERIGQHELIEKTANALLPEAYSKLITAQKKQPLGDPSFHLLKANLGEDWEIEVQIAEKPAVKLGEYKKTVKAAHQSAEKEIKEHAKMHEEEEKKAKKEGSRQPAKPHDHHHDDDSVRLHHIFRDLVKTIEPQIPELLVKQETERQLRQLVQQLDQLKLSLDDYLQRRNQSFEDLSTEMAAQSLGQLQLEFILQEIAIEAKIEVPEEEMKAEIEKNFPKNKDAAQNPYVLSHIRHNLQRRKITDFLLALTK